MNLMSARLDPETGLRNPTITEAQAADRVLMQLVFDLVSERGWNVDDSLYEITNVRAEIHTLLQARPRLPKQNALQHFSGNPIKGSGRGPRNTPYVKGGSKGKQKGKGKTRWISEAQINGVRKQLCMRFQTGKCNLSDCKFHHGCGFPLPNGEPCLKSHGALEHQQTSH